MLCLWFAHRNSIKKKKKIFRHYLFTNLRTRVKPVWIRNPAYTIKKFFMVQEEFPIQTGLTRAKNWSTLEIVVQGKSLQFKQHEFRNWSELRTIQNIPEVSKNMRFIVDKCVNFCMPFFKVDCARK
jgi:hypothetical protein